MCNNRNEGRRPGNNGNNCMYQAGYEAGYDAGYREGCQRCSTAAGVITTGILSGEEDSGCGCNNSCRR